MGSIRETCVNTNALYTLRLRMFDLQRPIQPFKREHMMKHAAHNVASVDLLENAGQQFEGCSVF